MRSPCQLNATLKKREKREGERSEPSELFRFLRTDVQERLEEGERSEPSELFRFLPTDGLAQCCQNFFVKMREKREGERSEPSELFRFLRTDVQERLEEGERSEPSELLRFAKFATFCNDCQLLMKKRDLI